MSGRAVQDRRIREARRAALRARLIGDGLLPERADGWIETWRRMGGDPSTAAFYEKGYNWIRAKFASSRQ